MTLLFFVENDKWSPINYLIVFVRMLNEQCPMDGLVSTVKIRKQEIEMSTKRVFLQLFTNKNHIPQVVLVNKMYNS